MEFAQLRYFLIASKSKNFSQAAKVAYTSRQNLAHSISRLEEEVGTPLFIRNGTQTELTYAGAALVPKIERILEEIDGLSDPRSAPDSRPSVNIAVAINTLTLYPQLCNDKMFELPITLSEHRAITCYDFVVEGQMDLVIVPRLGDTPPMCKAELISSEPIMYLCSAHSPLADKTSLDVHDFADHDVLLFPNSNFVYEDFLRTYNAYHVPESRIREIASVSLMKNEVRVHDAIGIANSEFANNPLMDWLQSPAPILP